MFTGMMDILGKFKIIVFKFVKRIQETQDLTKVKGQFETCPAYQLESKAMAKIMEDLIDMAPNTICSDGDLSLKKI